MQQVRIFLHRVLLRCAVRLLITRLRDGVLNTPVVIGTAEALYLAGVVAGQERRRQAMVQLEEQEDITMA